MKFCPLYSGSSGNAAFVGEERGGLLIDAGVPAAAVEAAMRARGISPRALKGILITHEHTDHICGAGALSRRYGLPVYANLATWEAMAHRLGRIAPEHARVFRTGQEFCACGLCIKPFATSHDAAESVGYAVTDAQGRRLVLMTDTGVVDERLLACAAGAHLLLLESNHDVQMLKNGRYPAALKRRILSDRGHLSNDAAAEALCALYRTGVRRALLGHMSEHNNTEDCVIDTTLCALQRHGIRPFEDLFVGLARRHEPGELVEV